MKFDRNAAGEGVEAVCRMENGRMAIEWKFAFIVTQWGEDKDTLRLTLRDPAGEVVLLCMQRALEEEALTSMILRPQLWNFDRPYLYELEATLSDCSGRETDRLVRQLSLRVLYCDPRRGWMLNGEEFILKAVDYPTPRLASQRELQQRVLRDVKRIKEMGANCVRCEKTLHKLCEKAGLLVWREELAKAGEVLPWPEEDENGQTPSLFYRYRARWNREPFVYIVPESISVLPSGNFKVTVYSSESRVALYSDGVLFEFLSGQEEFIFQEVPAKGPCVMLSAEGEGSSMSLSFHKMFPLSDRSKAPR